MSKDLAGLALQKTDDKLDTPSLRKPLQNCLCSPPTANFYSLDVAKLPAGRGHGEPIRMFIDMEQDAAIVSLFANKGRPQIPVASRRPGFFVNEDDCVSNTRKGKQVLNVEMPNEAVQSQPSPATWWRRSAPTTRWCCFRSTKSRKWRAAAACGCKIHQRLAVRRRRVRFRRWVWPERFRRPRAEHDDEGIVRLARQPRRRWPPRARPRSRTSFNRGVE